MTPQGFWFVIKAVGRANIACDEQWRLIRRTYLTIVLLICCYSTPTLYCFILQIICVIVPIGQKVHQVLGLNSAITTKPSSIEVSITL